MDSVRRLLSPDTPLVDVVFMWRRRRWALGYAAGAGAAALAIASAFGYGTWSTRVGLAACAAVMAALVATEQYVIADTGTSLELLRASSIRQVAVTSLRTISPSVPIDVVSSNLIVTEWQIGTERFSVPRRFGRAMTAATSR